MSRTPPRAAPVVRPGWPARRRRRRWRSRRAGCPRSGSRARARDWRSPATARADLPDGAVEPQLNGVNVHDPAALAAAIGTALGSISPRPKRVALVLPDTIAKVSLIRFEKAPERVQDLGSTDSLAGAEGGAVPPGRCAARLDPGCRCRRRWPRVHRHRRPARCRRLVRARVRGGRRLRRVGRSCELQPDEHRRWRRRRRRPATGCWCTWATTTPRSRWSGDRIWSFFAIAARAVSRSSRTSSTRRRCITRTVLAGAGFRAW